MIKKLSLLTLLSLATLSASDALKPIIQVGYDFGGTALATVEHPESYYSYAESNTIRAGQGLNLELGASLSNPNSNMELQFLVGYKFDQDSASNGDVVWDVIPFTALAMFSSNRWKFGGGVTYHLNPKIDGTFSGYDNNGDYFKDSIHDEYESTFGGVVEVQYKITNSATFGLKGTFIEYKLKQDPSIIAKGNSVGLNFSYTFGNERSEFR